MKKASVQPPASPCQRAISKLFYIYPQNGTSLVIKHVKQQPNTNNTVHLLAKAKDYEANVSLVLQYQSYSMCEMWTKANL